MVRIRREWRVALLGCGLVAAAAAQTWEQDPLYRPALETQWEGESALVWTDHADRLVFQSRGIVGGRPVRGLVRLTVDGRLDPTFATDEVSRAVLAIGPDGKIYALRAASDFETMYLLERLTESGAVDPSFGPRELRGSSTAAVRMLPGGGTVLWGEFTTIDRVAVRPVVKLRADGNLDPAFTAPWADGTNLRIQDLTPLSDGALAVLAAVPGSPGVRFLRLGAAGSVEVSVDVQALLGGNPRFVARLPGDAVLVRTSESPDYASVVKLSRDGTVDPGFVPDFGTDWRRIHLTGGGHVYFSTGFDLQEIRRLRFDGSRDPSFVFVRGFSTVLPEYFAATDSGELYVGSAVTNGQRGTGRTLSRLRSDGTFDAAFAPRIGVAAAVHHYSVLPDGKVVVSGAQKYCEDVPCGPLLRLNADGTRDAGFQAPFVATESVGRMVALSDGSLIVEGDFPETAPGRALVRLRGDGTLDRAFNAPTGFTLLSRFNSADTTALVATKDLPRRAHRIDATGAVDAGFPINRGTVDLTTPDGELYVFTAENLHYHVAHYARDGTLVGDRTSAIGRMTSVFALPNGRYLETVRSSRLGPNGTENYQAAAVRDRAGAIVAKFDTTDLDYRFVPTLLAQHTGAGEVSYGFDPSIGSFCVRGDGVGWFTPGSVNFGPRQLERSVFGGTAAALAPRVTAQPGYGRRTVQRGTDTLVFFGVIGAHPITFQWFKNGVLVPGANQARLDLPAFGPGMVGAYHAVATNAHGTVTSRTVELALLDPAEIYRPAGNFTVPPAMPGATVTLTAPWEFSVPVTWRWSRDGATLFETAGPVLSLPAVSAADTGIYTVSAYATIDGVNLSWFRSTLVTVVPSGGTVGRMLGISTRCDVGSGNDTLIAGLAVQGPAPRRILVRGVGPGLRPYMGAGATVLADPEIEVFNVSAQSLFKNDDWEKNPAGTAAVSSALATLGLFPLEAGAKDAALLVDLAPGAYTVHLRDKSGGRGVGLVEFYEVGASGAATRLLGISSRARVRPGDGLLIPGIVIEGSTPRRLLIRGLGPKLKEYGINDHLPDPSLQVLRLVNGAWTNVAWNDDWYRAADYLGVVEDDLDSVTRSLGLAALAPGSRDAALLVTLPPGVYTIQLGSGIYASAGDTGVALVEVYDVP